MEHIVRLSDGPHAVTFRIDYRRQLAFWRVEVDGREPWLSAIRVTGNEQPEFFRRMAEVARGSHSLGTWASVRQS